MNKIKLAAAQIAIHNAQNEEQLSFPSDFACKSGDDCLDYSNVDWRTASLVDELTDGDPIIVTTDIIVEAVEPTDEGGEVEEIKSCPSGFSLGEDVCYQIIGYEQVISGRKKLINDPAKQHILDDFNAKEAAKVDMQEKILKGKKARQTCDDVLDYISGYNQDRELSIEDISSLQGAMSDIEKALQSGRPTLAKTLITAVEPDGNLVTQELKDTVLILLNEY